MTNEKTSDGTNIQILGELIGIGAATKDWNIIIHHVCVVIICSVRLLEKLEEISHIIVYYHL